MTFSALRYWPVSYTHLDVYKRQAGWLAPFLTAELMTEISIIGGVFIMSSGFAILELKKFKTLNMLPALIVPAVWTLLLKCFS